MRITQYLNQDATYRKRTGEGFWSDGQFEPPITIKVRREVKHKLHKKPRHEGWIDVTEYMTEHPIYQGDQLDGVDLYAIEHIVDLKGRIIGYLGYPRPPVGFAN